MRKAMKVSLLTVVAAAGLAGCVKQDWQATFSGGSNAITMGRSLAKDSAGNVYIAGDVQSTNGTASGPFVAAYGPAGNQLWNRTISSGVSGFSGRVVLDASGNVYLATLDYNSVVTLYKIDAQGTLVNSWQVATSVGFLDDIKIGPDQNIYVSLNSGQQLLVYSGLGALLWQHSGAQSAVSAQGVTAGASTVPHYGELDFENGLVVQASATGVTSFDSQGQVKSTLTASALGMAEITSMAVVANGVDVLADDSQQLNLVRLDSSLNVLGTTAVGAFEGNAMLATAGGNLCIENAPQSDMPVGGATVTYHIYGFTLDATKLFDTVVTAGNNFLWVPGKLEGNAAGCDFSEMYEPSNSAALTSKVTHVSSTGKVVNGIQNKNYVGQDFLLSGNDVFEVGTLGLGTLSTRAVLTKYTRY